MSKIEGSYNTEYLNLPTFHNPPYNMRASFLLRKKHPNGKKAWLQYILNIISLYIPT